MDSLDDLPVDDESTLTPRQRATMHKYTTGPGAPSTQRHSTRGSPGKQKRNRTHDADESSEMTDDTDIDEASEKRWKIIGYIVVIFVVIANPFIDPLLSKVPYFGGSSMTEFLLKAIVFVIAIMIVMFYA